MFWYFLYFILIYSCVCGNNNNNKLGIGYTITENCNKIQNNRKTINEMIVAGRENIGKQHHFQIEIEKVHNSFEKMLNEIMMTKLILIYIVFIAFIEYWPIQQHSLRKLFSFYDTQYCMRLIHWAAFIYSFIPERFFASYLFSSWFLANVLP